MDYAVNDLVQKQNELLREQNQLLRKQNELLSDQHKLLAMISQKNDTQTQHLKEIVEKLYHVKI